MYKVYADASVKGGGRAFHSYFILDKYGRFIDGVVFTSSTTSTQEAENLTVAEVISMLKSKGVSEAEIFTDNVSTATHYNKVSPYRVTWTPRENNRLADLACSLGQFNFYKNNPKLIKIWCGFLKCEEPEEFILNRINPLTTKEKHKLEMISIYKDITGDTITVDELFSALEGVYSFSSARGRKYAVYQLAVYNYFTDEHTKNLHKKLKNKELIVQEAREIKLTEEAYRQYIKCTQKNKNVSFKKAKRKLYRDIQLGVLDSVHPETGYTAYSYGHLKIWVRDNTIERIEKQTTTPYNWRKDKKISNSFNKILGL